jgi:hypothetical protein
MATQKKPKDPTKRRRKPKAKAEKVEMVPFPKLLTRAIEDLNKRFQEDLSLRVSEAVEDLGLRGRQVQVDMQNQRFLVTGDAPPAPEAEAPDAAEKPD